MMSEKLHHYLHLWELSDPQPLAQTTTSHVYTVLRNGETVVLKLLTPIGVHDEQSSAVALTCFGGKGAVQLLQHDEGAHLLEYVSGDDLIPMVQQGNDEEATAIIAGVLNHLHSAYKGILPDGLWSLRRWFQSLFDKAEQDQQVGRDSVYVRAAPLAETLLTNPQDECVLHGDMHHENVRHHAQRGWLAFDPKGLYGERTFDAANVLCNPMQMPDLVTDETRLLRNAEILAQHMKIDLSRILSFVFVYACLSASWALSDGDNPGLALKVAAIVEPYIHSG